MVHCIQTHLQPSSNQCFLIVTTTTRMLIRKCIFLIISVLVSLVSCSDERYCDTWMWLIVHFTSNFSCGTRFYDSEFAIGGRDATHGPWTVSLGELYWINLPDSVKIINGYYTLQNIWGYTGDDGEYVHVCTGSILSNNVVITAAHCTREEDGWDMRNIL